MGVKPLRVSFDKIDGFIKFMMELKSFGKNIGKIPNIVCKRLPVKVIVLFLTHPRLLQS